MSQRAIEVVACVKLADCDSQAKYDMPPDSASMGSKNRFYSSNSLKNQIDTILLNMQVTKSNVSAYDTILL